MEAKTAADGIKRFLMWNSAGDLVDVGHRHMEWVQTPNVDQDFFTAPTQETEIGRTTSLEVRLTNLQQIEAVRDLRRSDNAQVQAAILSFTKHTLWQRWTRFNIQPDRSGAGGMAPEIVRLRSRELDPPIFQVQSLTSGYPWEDGTITSWAAGYNNPSYKILAAGETVDSQDWGWQILEAPSVAQFTPDGYLETDGRLIMDLILPAASASFRLNVPSVRYDRARLQTYSVDGNVLQTVGEGEQLTLTGGDWRLRVEVQPPEASTMLVERPRLIITDAGRARQPVPRTSSYAADWMKRQTQIEIESEDTVSVAFDGEVDRNHTGKVTGRVDVPSGAGFNLVSVTPIRVTHPEPPIPEGYLGQIRGTVDLNETGYEDRGMDTPISVTDPFPLENNWRGRILGTVQAAEFGLDLTPTTEAAPLVVESPAYVPWDYEGTISGRLEGSEIPDPATNDLSNYRVAAYYYSPYRNVRRLARWEYCDAAGNWSVTISHADVANFEDELGPSAEVQLLVSYEEPLGTWNNVPNVTPQIYWNADITDGRSLTKYDVHMYLHVDGDTTYRRSSEDGWVLDNGEFIAYGATTSGRRLIDLYDSNAAAVVGNRWRQWNQGKRLTQWNVDLKVVEVLDQTEYDVAVDGDVYTDGTWVAYNEKEETLPWKVELVHEDTLDQPYGYFFRHSHRYENLSARMENWVDLMYHVGTDPVYGEGRFEFTDNSEGTKIVKAVDDRTGGVVGHTSAFGLLPRSFDLEPSDPDYGTRYRHRVYGYDAALALLLACGLKQPGEADRYAQGVLGLQNTGQYIFPTADHPDHTGRTNYSDSVGCFAWFTDHYEPANWYNYYGEPVFRTSTDGWCGYALGKYMERYPNGQHFDAAHKALYRLLNHWENFLHPSGDPYYGMPMFGYNSWGGPPDWVWTVELRQHVGFEAMLEVWWCCNQAFKVTGDTRFSDLRDTVKNGLLTGMWIDGPADVGDSANDGWDVAGFGSGIHVDTTWFPAEWPAGSRVNRNRTMDQWSWGGIWLNAVGEQAKIDTMLQSLYHWKTQGETSRGTPVWGYMAHRDWGGYTGAVPSVWFEGSFGAALHFWRQGMTSEYNTLVDNLRRGQLPDGGFQYTTKEDERYQMVTYPAVGSTAWAVLATQLRGYMWASTEVSEPNQTLTPPVI